MAQSSDILLGHSLLAFHNKWLIALTRTFIMTKKKKQQKQKEKFSKGTSLEKNWITEDTQKKILNVLWDKLGLVKEKEIPRFLFAAKGADAQKSGQMHEYQNCWLHMKKFFLLMGDDLSALFCGKEVYPGQPLPMSPMTVCNYISYICLRDETYVCDPTNQNPIKDQLVMTCCP
jgi:hypothetical protein